MRAVLCYEDIAPTLRVVRGVGRIGPRRVQGRGPRDTYG